MPRKKKVFQCKKCSFHTTGPSGMSAHYKRFQSHASKSSVWVRNRRAAQRAAVLPLEPAEPRPRRRGRAFKFCPECGHDLLSY